MKKNKVLSILVLIVFFILGFIFLRGRTDELIKIFEINLEYILIIFILTILLTIFRGQRYKFLTSFYNTSLKFKEWWGLEMVTEFGNAITPFKGGTSASAVYLKKKHKFAYTHFVSTIGIDYIFTGLGNGIFGFIATFFLPVQNEFRYGLLIFFFLVILSCGILLFVIPSQSLYTKSNIRLLNHLLNSVSELRRIKTEYLLLFKMSLNFLARKIIIISRIYFIFLAFGMPIPFHFAVIISALSSILASLSITPMGLGFKEAVFVIGSELVGSEAMTGFLVAAIDRIIGLVWCFIAAPIFSYILLEDFKHKK